MDPTNATKGDVHRVVTIPTPSGVATLDHTLKALRIIVDRVRTHPVARTGKPLDGWLAVLLDKPMCHGRSRGGGKVDVRIIAFAVKTTSASAGRLTKLIWSGAAASNPSGAKG